AGGTDYLWAFVRRTDAQDDVAADVDPLRSAIEQPGATWTGAVRTRATWRVPLEERLAIIEQAAVLLAERAPDSAANLQAAARAARSELGVPVPILQVAGQDTELRYETPRGLGLMRATGP